MRTESLTIEVDATRRVSALLLRPPEAVACYVFAHGAGAGMEHASMQMVATDLAELGIATLRYQFPYMEQRSRRIDAPAVCHRTVRAAVAAAAQLDPDLPLVAGGRSFGGRMTSQAQAGEALPGVRGLVFLSFPLHPAKSPATERGQHLFDVALPMLFLQGARDELAYPSLLEPLVQELGARATLKLYPDADHSWHVPARSGRTDAQVRAEALDEMVRWINEVAREQ
jgi:predicted alpha/beta-hydrolase family hydrolase